MPCVLCIAASPRAGTHSGMHRYTYFSDSNRPASYLLLDACHVTSDGDATLSNSPPGKGSLKGRHPCQVANVSVGVGNASTIVVTATILTHGALTGRSPLGGVWVYLYVEVNLPVAMESSAAIPDFGLWQDNVLEPAVRVFCFLVVSHCLRIRISRYSNVGFE